LRVDLRAPFVFKEMNSLEKVTHLSSNCVKF
jgi:hypothetical protein